MKNTSLILNVILALAIVGIYVLHFSSKDSESAVADQPASSASNTDLKIAYVKVDSLILNYDLAQELHATFSKNQEAYTKEYADKRSSFEKRAAEFQEKVQRGGFLTQDRAIQERDRLVSEEQEILSLDQELSTKLAEMQSANNKQLIDSLMSYLKEFNANKNYDYIFNAGDVLIGDEAHNITKEVLDAMNARYNKKQ